MADLKIHREVLEGVFKATGELTFKQAHDVLNALDMWCGDRNIDCLVAEVTFDPNAKVDFECEDCGYVNCECFGSSL